MFHIQTSNHLISKHDRRICFRIIDNIVRQLIDKAVSLFYCITFQFRIAAVFHTIGNLEGCGQFSGQRKIIAFLILLILIDFRNPIFVYLCRINDCSAFILYNQLWRSLAQQLSNIKFSVLAFIHSIEHWPEKAGSGKACCHFIGGFSI